MDKQLVHVDKELLEIELARREQLEDKLKMYEDVIKQGFRRVDENDDEPPIVVPKVVARSLIENKIKSAQSSESIEQETDRLYDENLKLLDRIAEISAANEILLNEIRSSASEILELQNQLQIHAGIGKTIEQVKKDVVELKKDVVMIKRDGVIITQEKRTELQADFERFDQKWDVLKKSKQRMDTVVFIIGCGIVAFLCSVLYDILSLHAMVPPCTLGFKQPSP